MAMKFELDWRIGKYPILKEIGKGATSKVFLGRDPFADRDVAIKVFFFEDGATDLQRKLLRKGFLAEAALAGRLQHPHIVEIYDAVSEPEYSYIVMEHVPGTTLESYCEVDSLLPLGKVVEIIFKCIRALDFAFQTGSSTATSSREISFTAPTAKSRSATSVRHSRSSLRRIRLSSPASDPRPTCRPSR